MHRTVMTSTHPGHQVAPSGPASLSTLLTVALGTALMVAAPLTMGIAAMQEGRLGRSEAHQIILADTTGGPAIEPSPVVSPRRFTAPIRIW
jgi:hypothetical protein